MAVKESELKKGKLTLGADEAKVEFACQATSVMLSPDVTEDGDALEVLCGDSITPRAITAWTLKLTAIQDWEDAKGVIMFAFDHDGESIPFKWQPSETSGTWSGSVQVRAMEIGGEVNVRLTSDAEWPCEGKPSLTPPTPNGAPVKTGA